MARHTEHAGQLELQEVGGTVNPLSHTDGYEDRGSVVMEGLNPMAESMMGPVSWAESEGVAGGCGGSGSATLITPPTTIRTRCAWLMERLWQMPAK